jgi:hypothetical protein
VLVNPAAATTTETVVKDVGAAARNLGLQVRMLNASTIREIESRRRGTRRQVASGVWSAPPTRTDAWVVRSVSGHSVRSKGDSSFREGRQEQDNADAKKHDVLV